MVFFTVGLITLLYFGRRELAEPHKLLHYLLQPRVLTLDPETIAVYLQAALKIFGVWTADLAERWDNDDLPKVKNMVDTLVERLGEFAANPDIEVQERVDLHCFLLRTIRIVADPWVCLQAANMLQLLTFMRADLTSFRPRASSSLGYDDIGPTPFQDTSPEPSFPKSLFLLRPLSSTYELNTVAPNAQEMVPVPEGLDLEAWIIPPPRDEPVGAFEEADGDEMEPVVKKKVRKGKRKETGEAKVKSGKKKRGHVPSYEDDMLQAEGEAEIIETEEERAARERVRTSFV